MQLLGGDVIGEVKRIGGIAGYGAQRGEIAVELLLVAHGYGLGIAAVFGTYRDGIKGLQNMLVLSLVP